MVKFLMPGSEDDGKRHYHYNCCVSRILLQMTFVDENVNMNIKNIKMAS